MVINLDQSEIKIWLYFEITDLDLNLLKVAPNSLDLPIFGILLQIAL